MIVTETREYIHSWYLLLITLFSLLFLLINRHLIFDLPIVVVSFFYFFKNGFLLSRLAKVSLYAFIFSFGFFALSILYPAKELRTGNIFHLYQFQFYQASIEQAFGTFIRLFFISTVSMSSGIVINYTKVILHLIVHKGLKLLWGYPMLLAMNSIVLFKHEYERIQINAKLRDLPFKDRIILFFPLLVFAIRHSQRGALALVTRGLNDKKSFYFSYDLSNLDRLRLLGYLSIYFFIVCIAIFFR
jgi:hypothetical protein